VQITDHEELHTTKWLFIAPVLPQHRVHGIEQIGPYHTDFINHQQIKALDNPFFFFAEPEHALPVFFMGLAAGNEGTKRELKKRMEGDAAGINGRNPGWGGNNHPFGHPGV